MSDCLFCTIRDGGVPADVVYSDETVLAFRDVAPQAPVHVLLIPKTHWDNAADFATGDPDGISHLIRVAGNLAIDLGIAETGHRLVFNTGVDGGQSVNHAHLHLLGGRRLLWPPG